jgi:hypothetical protein
MGNAKLLKKYALVDPTHLLESHGWHSIPVTHGAYTAWRNPKVPATLFVYPDGAWHLVNKLRSVVNSGHDIETLIAWLTGDVKPIEHIGSE